MKIFSYENDSKINELSLGMVLKDETCHKGIGNVFWPETPQLLWVPGVAVGFNLLPHPQRQSEISGAAGAFPPPSLSPRSAQCHLPVLR